MNLLHHIATAARENEIYRGLARLDARALADLGIERAEIGPLARLVAESGSADIHLQDALAQLRRDRAGAAPEPLTGLAARVARLWQAAGETDLGRSLKLRLLWRSAFRQARAELRAYSPRELMADLRLSPSNIDDLAAEAADDKVAAFVAANPAYRRVALAPRAAAA